ncbi:unnamed protein product [Adineta ricciae]|uniref:Uncharacterized protein n=1 Tax=Adineta ricciae TaxID=249248 RepID=A0A815UH16_ADIRI|nr:unnamed protein product [Adineta ricciae]CAF1598849.1 unnamed protein product [Adineta ricciae]
MRSANRSRINTGASTPPPSPSSSSSSTTTSTTTPPNSQSTNESSGEFLIVLTNSQHLLRRLAADYQNAEILRRSVSIGNDTTMFNTDRERLLTALLQVELRQVARDYLSRTRRSFPIQYLFNMSDIDSTHRRT